MGTRIREGLLLAALRAIRALDRRHPDLSRLGTTDIRNILIVSCTAIGDTLLSTPAIRSIRQQYPAARISLLLNQAYIPLFANNPDVDAIIPYAGGYRKFFRLAGALRRERFDLALILHGNEPQATPLTYLSGAPYRFKLPNDNDFRFLLTNRTPVLRWDDFPHGIDQRLAVAALAGATGTERSMVLPLAKSAMSRFSERRQQQGIPADAVLIGFQSGASTISRRWSAKRFAELGRRLLAGRENVWIVLTGSPGERQLAEQVASGIGRARVWNLAGALPLDELPAMVSALRTLVTGDTGPMHMAVALGTPVVALFAVSRWQRSGPAYGLERSVVIQKWRTCAPCLSKRCSYAEPPCMQNISVDEVEAAVLGQLEGMPGGVHESTAAEPRP